MRFAARVLKISGVFVALIVLALLDQGCAPKFNFTPGALGTPINISQADSSIHFTLPSNLLFPLNGSSPPAVPGQALNLSTSATDIEGNNPVTIIGCSYQTVGLSPSDPNYVAAGASCTSLPSLVSTNGTLVVSTASFSGGTLGWIPLDTQRGTYEFTVTGQNSIGGTNSANFYVTVRDDTSTANELLGLDSLFSMAASGLSGIASAPRLTANNNLSSWLDTFASSSLSLGTMSTSSPWSGTGQSSSPYAISLNGTSDYLNLGSVLGSSTKYRVSLWLNPSSAATANSVILTNASGTNGITLKQAADGTGDLVLEQGSSVTTYADAVLADSPVGYWHFDETDPTVGSASIVDSSGANYCAGSPCNFTYATDNSKPTVGSAAAYPERTGYAFYFNNPSGCSGALNCQNLTNMSATGYYFSDGAGNDQPFSMDALIDMDPGWPGPDSNGGAILSEWDTNSSQSWMLGIDGTKHLYFELCEIGGTNCIGRQYSAALSTGTWYHVAATYDGSESSAGIKVYLNGSEVDDTNKNSGTYAGNRYDAWLNIGWVSQSNGYPLAFYGSIDEPAIYASQLTAARILAHYNAWIANSYVVGVNSPLSNGTWAQVGILSDSTTAQLFYNGISIGTLNPGGGFNTNPASSMILGQSGISMHYWKGSVAAVGIFGSTDGSSVGSTSDFLNDQLTLGNRLRATPIENIVSSGLLFQVDAANAGSNLLAANTTGTGCSSNRTWAELMSEDSGTLYGSGEGFDSCPSDGWQGAGTSASPYALSFNGTDDYVDFGAASEALHFTNGSGTDQPFSIEAWVKPTTNSGGGLVITCKQDDTTNDEEYCLWIDGTAHKYAAEIATNTSNDEGVEGPTVATNVWSHVVMTYDGSGSNAGLKIYVNGTLQATTPYATGAYTGMTNSTASLKIGGVPGGAGSYYKGDIAVFRIYNAALTLNQIKQNCWAQKARFSGASCAAP